MLKNYKTSLLVVATLFSASHNVGYAQINFEEQRTANKSAPSVSSEDDFEVVDGKNLKQVRYGLNPLEDGMKTGFALAKLGTNLSKIYVNAQLAWGNLNALNFSGLISNVTAIKTAGEEIYDTLKQIPAALNKAVLHKARVAYHIDEARDSKFVKTVSSWFGW
jgi:hypothetical protein